MASEEVDATALQQDNSVPEPNDSTQQLAEANQSLGTEAEQQNQAVGEDVVEQVAEDLKDGVQLAQDLPDEDNADDIADFPAYEQAFQDDSYGAGFSFDASESHAYLNMLQQSYGSSDHLPAEAAALETVASADASDPQAAADASDPQADASLPTNAETEIPKNEQDSTFDESSRDPSYEQLNDLGSLPNSESRSSDLSSNGPIPPPRPPSSNGSHSRSQSAASRPLPPTPDEPSHQELQTVKYYLKQAIDAKDHKAMRDLLAKAKTLPMQSSDDLVAHAESLVSEHDSTARLQEVETIRFYLKQAMESKSREALKVAIDKADKLNLGSSSKMHSDFTSLVNEARKMLLALDAENAETITFYLKQGIQLKNRDVLKQACAKAATMKPGTVDAQLFHRASELLQHLDAEALILFYLECAIKQKDIEALEITLEKAQKLNMSPQIEQIKVAQHTLVHLKKKKRATAPGPLNTGPGKIKSFFTGGVGGLAKKKQISRIFGIPLDQAIARSDLIIPKLCYTCAEFIRQHGMNEPGIFRVSGNADTMEVIKHGFDDDEDVKLQDVNDAAGVFKQYIRSLPEPLFPFNFYKDFLAIASSLPPKDPTRRQQLKALISKLPAQNIDLLRYLMLFLHELSRHEVHTKMSPSNLAIVFAPNLLRPQVDTPESMLTEMPLAIGIIATLIDFAPECFDAPPESLAKPSA